jgi:hypothetical protein
MIKLTFPQEILEDALKKVEPNYKKSTRETFKQNIDWHAIFYGSDNESSHNNRMNTERNLNVATSDKEEEDYRALIYKQNIKLEGMKQQYKEQEYYDMLWNQYLQSRAFTEKGA